MDQSWVHTSIAVHLNWNITCFERSAVIRDFKVYWQSLEKYFKLSTGARNCCNFQSVTICLSAIWYSWSRIQQSKHELTKTLFFLAAFTKSVAMSQISVNCERTCLPPTTPWIWHVDHCVPSTVSWESRVDIELNDSNDSCINSKHIRIFLHLMVGQNSLMEILPIYLDRSRIVCWLEISWILQRLCTSHAWEHQRWSRRQCWIWCSHSLPSFEFFFFKSNLPFLQF